MDWGKQSRNLIQKILSRLVWPWQVEGFIFFPIILLDSFLLEWKPDAFAGLTLPEGFVSFYFFNVFSLLHHVRYNIVSINLFLFIIAKSGGHDTSFERWSLDKNYIIKKLIIFYFQEHFWFLSLPTNSKGNYTLFCRIIYSITVCLSSRKMSLCILVFSL